MEFFKKSVAFVVEAPAIGHGTGSIPKLFRQAASGQGGAAIASVNPHNQILAVAIQLGVLGTAVLLAMWLAQLSLFGGPGMVAWLGLIVVTQNMVSSLFNSHIADFGQGWLYVFGVGVLGGMMLRQNSELG